MLYRWRFRASPVTGLQRPMGFCDRVRIGAFLRWVWAGWNGASRSMWVYRSLLSPVQARPRKRRPRYSGASRHRRARLFFCEVGVARAARFSTCPRFNGNELTNYVFKGCCSFVRGELRASATSTDRSLPQPKTKVRRRSRWQDRRRAESGSNAACRPCSSSTIAASSAPTLRKTDNTTH